MRLRFLALVFTGLGWAVPLPAQLTLPYAEAGLTDTQAAAHLLDRLGYGPQPGEVALVAEGGVENWLRDQLQPGDDTLTRLAESYPALAMSTTEISRTYPGPGVRIIFAMRQRDLPSPPTPLRRRGETAARRISQEQRRDYQRMMPDSMGNGGGQNAMLNRILNVEDNPNAGNPRSLAYNERLGYRPLEELTYHTMAQKLDRAIHSEYQLVEQLTDFWFNHFNVTVTSVNEATPHLLSYERDAIRPHVLGNFRDMLGATARHPAMLLYLNNHRSNAAKGVATLRPLREPRQPREDPNGFGQKPGINENYARELLELHTLGVDGGYSQRDIEEVARAFTGWKLNPATYPLPEMAERLLDRRARQPDVVMKDGFFFDPSRHDAEEKTVLGEHFPAGGGLEEGERILDLLATHPATARHLATKLAVRFVSDEPSEELIGHIAAAFLASGGDLRQTTVALIEHPDFWASRTAKIKTPLEYIASSVRATGARVTDTRELLRWSTRMGQPLFAYQAPTGYPERAGHWTNGAALINRMNFGLDLAQNRIAGVEVDLLALNRNHEPSGPRDALATYLPLLLPERDTKETYTLLLPNLEGELGQIVGLILGSPEFQRQ
jgi:uncharacterized protein (DUF1800 family)